jgi:V/A-type H+-transporting ATPase subunit F
MYKVAVMGDKDSIYGFASLGLSIFPTDDSKEAIRTLRNLSKNGYAVIFITEALYSEITDEADNYRDDPSLTIIPIPGVKGNTGIGMADVSKSVEKAVGSDIIS